MKNQLIELRWNLLTNTLEYRDRATIGDKWSEWMPVPAWDGSSTE